MLNQDDIEEWFPDAEVVTVPADALPPALTDPAARTLLIDNGLPSNLLDVVELDPDLPERMRTLEDEYQDADSHAPSGAAGVLFLGFAGQMMLGLVPDSGAVVQVHSDIGVRPLASTLESFVRVLGDVSLRVTAYQDARDFDTERFAPELRAAARRLLERLDPAALPDAEPAWNALLDDIAAAAAWE